MILSYFCNKPLNIKSSLVLRAFSYFKFITGMRFWKCWKYRFWEEDRQQLNSSVSSTQTAKALLLSENWVFRFVTLEFEEPAVNMAYYKKCVHSRYLIAFVDTLIFIHREKFNQIIYNSRQEVWNGKKSLFSSFIFTRQFLGDLATFLEHIWTEAQKKQKWTSLL